ncbi:MAG: SMP-30/gluconolactonase/LRE family protein [Tidjanibacter sp.]|nr:SMP-30/gluconolactonase/LRE family protein [Tidjanibacter sp.]
MRKSLSLMLLCLMFAIGASAQGESAYKQKFADPNAEFFTPENYGIKADGKMDVSDQLQAAINKVKTDKNFGTLYIPEGKYLISKTIYVPGAVRLIGYGEKRPEIILAKNTFVDQEGWMFWYTGGLVTPERAPGDAGAGTFYSGFSNINLRIEKGNPMAIALRTHYAQHGVLNHVDIHAGDALACLRDVGNEMENVRFFGGQYGITSGPTSPSWPMAIVDVYFEGQKKAAVVTRNASISFVNMIVKNAPIGVIMENGVTDRVYIEASQFENVGTAVVSTVADEACNQVNILGLECKNVPILFTAPNQNVPVAHKLYNVKDFTYGLVVPEMGAVADFDLISEVEPIDSFKIDFKRTIPALPEMSTWVSVLDFGAKGDGETDDTEAIKKAIASAQNVFFPEGWYRISETIKMQPNTALIGMHPFATQFILAESTPAFSGFGAPVAMVESGKGGDNIFNGIGITTGGYNYRAVGIKWMAGAGSLMNDVKFVGGHGTMSKPRPANAPAAPRQSYSAASRISSPTNPIAVQGLDQAWDNQYWSLWVTDGGGGTIKDIWTANTYAGSGFYLSNTDTPGIVYAMSLEHHVRTESRMSNVKNWKFYAMQYEEESREGEHCVSLVMDNCEDLLFANSRFYRVIRVKTPRDFGMQVSNCKNIEFRNMHTWTQILPLTAATAYDVNKNISLYANDFARATITGNEKSARPAGAVGEVVKIGKGYRFATGAVADSKGNVYFCENQLKKIHKWDASTGTISVVADYPYKPFSLAMDTEDNLIVICRYDPQPGYLVDGKPEVVSRLPDDNPDYSSWGNSGWAALAFAIDTKSGSDNMVPLKRVASSSISSPKRVVVPTHRYRGDFSKVAQAMPENSFLAPDGVTIIPETYDLGRSVQLVSFAPSQSAPVYMAWENTHTVSKLSPMADGRLSEVAPKMFKRGEYSIATDKSGNVYIAEGDIFVYNPDGKLIDTITCEERPLSMAFGGADGNTLFITTNNSLYKVRVK